MRRFVTLLCAAGTLLAPAAWGHPDLLAQIGRLDEQLQADPGNADLLIRRGDLHRRHEDYTAAADDFALARSLSADHPQLDFYQGRLALQQGDLSAAVSYFDRHLARHPDDPIGWRLLGEARLRQGDTSAAADFERSVSVSATPSPDLYRQWILALLQADRQAEALQVIDQGLVRFGSEVSLLGLGADVALTIGDATRARLYLGQLPRGLEQRSPWSDRLQAVRCLEQQSAGLNGLDASTCSVEAGQRLAAGLTGVTGAR
jgi:tetratricopeptide (TPR) repeat protein